MITDIIGRPVALHLTGGNVADIRAAPALLAKVVGRLRRLIGDKGYDSDGLRAALRREQASPVIPGRRNRKRPIRHDRVRYRKRWRIEAAFCRLKDFRRVATRYDKLGANFLSAVAIAAIVAHWT
jgi:transposase